MRLSPLALVALLPASLALADVSTMSAGSRAFSTGATTTSLGARGMTVGAGATSASRAPAMTQRTTPSWARDGFAGRTSPSWSSGVSAGWSGPSEWPAIGAVGSVSSPTSVSSVSTTQILVINVNAPVKGDINVAQISDPTQVTGNAGIVTVVDPSVTMLGSDGPAGIDTVVNFDGPSLAGTTRPLGQRTSAHCPGMSPLTSRQ